MGKVREGITDALKKKKHKKRKHGELDISVGEDIGDVELGLSGLSEVAPAEAANVSEDNMPRKKKKKEKSRTRPEDGNNREEMEKLRKIGSVEDACISNTVEAAGGLSGVESDEKSTNAELAVVNEEVQPKKGKKDKKKSKLESESIGGEGTCLSDVDHVASAEKKFGDMGTDKVNHLKNKKQKETVFETNEKEEPSKDNTQDEKKDILEETDKFKHVEGQSKKEKREKKKQKDSGDGCSHQDDSSKRSLNSENKDIHEAVGRSTLGEDQNDSVTAEVESDKKSERTKKKKHKERVNDTNIASGNDGKGSRDGAKKRKKKLPAISTEENVDAADSVTSGRNKPLENSEKSNPSKRSRKVKFSDTVEIFSLPENSGEGDKNLVDEGQSNNAVKNVADGKKKQKKRIVQDGLVYGKRFSKEEDEILRNAVLKYIEDHELGEEGVEMVMKCRQHWDKVKDCWTEIAEALPWRHREAIYSRAHILFERSETHKWSREELEDVRKYHEKHGPKWRQLADAIGRNRIHVKDAFRQIKLPNRKSGQWSQDEYQNLFNLVNKDLRIRASMDRKSKHGMLRDNIGWEAISHQLTTRTDPMCCLKWYSQLSSAMVADGQWADTDDYRLLMSLVDLDATCEEDVEWDHVLEHRDGEVCRKRWNEMLMHIGEHGNKLFSEQVEILSQRYCPDVLEARETYESKPFVD